MKKFLVVCILAIVSLAFAVHGAEAGNPGEGDSFGTQSQSLSRLPEVSDLSADTASTSGSVAAAEQSRPAGSWRSAVGRILLGLGLGALMSQFGIGGVWGSMIATILAIALLAIVVMFIARQFRDRNDYGDGSTYVERPSFQDMRNTLSRIEPTRSPSSSGKSETVVEKTSPSTDTPENFDMAGFIRSAKTYFIRLQAAWDRADVIDIREFTTPEMFDELEQQLRERGITPSHTTILALDAELLEIETGNDTYLATVKFSGTIKDAEDASAELFTEIWKLSKPESGASGWVLAGIQQFS